MLVTLNDLLPEATRASRRQILRDHGFDMAHSPRFLEALLVGFIGGQATAYSDAVDCVTEAGVRVEIKSANVGIARRQGQRDRERFTFSALQGATGKGKEADVFVLVGIKGERVFLWVLPSAVVGSRSMIQMQAGGYERQGRDLWRAYLTHPTDLPLAIDQAASSDPLPSR